MDGNPKKETKMEPKKEKVVYGDVTWTKYQYDDGKVRYIWEKHHHCKSKIHYIDSDERS